MQGILVVNAFWKGASMKEMEGQLCRAAKEKGIQLQVRTNAELMCMLPPVAPLSEEEADFYLFWDKDVRLAMQLEMLGKRLFNPAKAIALCDDKTLTHLALAKEDIPMPQTILCPQTFPSLGYPETDFLSRAGKALSWPLIIKEGCGSFGQQVYLAKDENEAAAILQKAAGVPLLFQQYIRECKGQDIRLYMVGGKCVAAMRRVNEADFRANIQIGGHAEAYTPTQEEIALAQKACRALSLDFAGVDLLQSEQGPLLCEVNSNAHFTALAALTGEDVAGAIFDHIREELCAAG